MEQHKWQPIIDQKTTGYQQYECKLCGTILNIDEDYEERDAKECPGFTFKPSEQKHFEFGVK